MRAMERQPGESARAFEHYKVYRDLGPGRTLVKASEIYYGSRANLAQTYKWSTRWDWPARAAQRDDYVDMIRRQAQDELQIAQATERASREEELRETNLANEEHAARVEKLYITAAEELIQHLPLITQTTVREPDPDNPDLQPGIYILQPATKNAVLDAARLHRIATRNDTRAKAGSDPEGPALDNADLLDEQADRERDPEVFDAQDQLWEAQERARARREGARGPDRSS